MSSPQAPAKGGGNGSGNQADSSNGEAPASAVASKGTMVRSPAHRPAGRPASVRPASTAEPTDTPATLSFCRRRSDSRDAGLFRSGPSGPAVSSGTAETDVVVAVTRLVRVTVRGAHVLRVVDP